MQKHFPHFTIADQEMTEKTGRFWV